VDMVAMQDLSLRLYFSPMGVASWPLQ